ncbi:SDR family oxidoreductase [Nocardia pseudobrasiliensis]|uniref:2,3-dihydro-2,3-dihydroxybenzoate dehydrogenase n=1 Tax=Nocardia pseudobrasiliensis TaxID=45979 RepID=A0A370HWC1_9NOCA|nr:SDR family oxidoreductase [Nocardia pseudobrasiliensis]RDI62806.1 2,3-dihydro-2,3-dihydroxybenzoate dehydrogenase [Nocardia pseudobrasiliensis]
MSMIDSDGRVLVVTGAAAGIGAAVAADLARGARAVALWDLDPRVHDVASEIAERTTAFVHATEVDVADEKSVTEAFDALTARYGPADVLVHAAGVMDAGTALDITPQAWQRSLAVNATGTVHVIQRAARDMVAAGRGAIVVVTSNAASTPRVGMAAYCASKAAATAFTKSLALQVAPHGVRVNLVSPGSTNTAMLRGLYDAEELTESARAGLLDGAPEDFRLGIPLRRIAEPADIAAAVRFLVSDDARHITMHDLRVDGGATLDM